MATGETEQCHPSHRMADDDRVAQVEHRQHLGDVVGQPVQPVTSGTSSRSTVASQIERDDAVVVG